MFKKARDKKRQKQQQKEREEIALDFMAPVDDDQIEGFEVTPSKGRSKMMQKVLGKKKSDVKISETGTRVETDRTMLESFSGSSPDQQDPRQLVPENGNQVLHKIDTSDKKKRRLFGLAALGGGGAAAAAAVASRGRGGADLEQAVTDTLSEDAVQEMNNSAPVKKTKRGWFGGEKDEQLMEEEMPQQSSRAVSSSGKQNSDEQYDSRYNPTKQQRGYDEDESKSSFLSRCPKWMWILLCVLLALLILGLVLGLTLPKKNRDRGADTSVTAVEELEAAPSVDVEIYFDDYASELSWSLVNVADQTVIAEVAAGTYADGTAMVLETVPNLNFSTTYTWQISDEGGDGQCCDTPGNYTLFYGTEVLASDSGDWGEQNVLSFTVYPGDKPDDDDGN